jgi:hypothetical protein
LPDFVGLIDVGLAAGGSSFANQTYYGQPHPDAPEMLVVGQDVGPAAIDSLIPLALRLTGIGVGPAVVVDAVTSTAQGSYDLLRVADAFQTYGGVGFYLDDSGDLRIACIIYALEELWLDKPVPKIW